MGATYALYRNIFTGTEKRVALAAATVGSYSSSTNTTVSSRSGSGSGSGSGKKNQFLNNNEKIDSMIGLIHPTLYI